MGNSNSNGTLIAHNTLQSYNGSITQNALTGTPSVDPLRQKSELQFLDLGGNGIYQVRLYESHVLAEFKGLLGQPADEKYRQLVLYFGHYLPGLVAPANTRKAIVTPSISRPILHSYPIPKVVRHPMHNSAQFGGLPVFTKVGTSEEIMSIAIPLARSINELPLPTNKLIRLREVPNQVIASVAFTGTVILYLSNTHHSHSLLTHTPS